MSSYVYVIRAGDYVKIGKADNPRGRIDGFRTGNPHKIEVITTIEYEDAKAAFCAERAMHRHFGEIGLRHDREWFRWTPGLEATALAMGTYFHHRNYDDRECESQFMSYADSYITGQIGTFVHAPNRHMYLTEYPGANPGWRLIGSAVDASFDAAGDHYHQLIAPYFYGPFCDGDGLHLGGFVNEYDDHYEVHSGFGAYITMPKSHQVRIAALIGSDE